MTDNSQWQPGQPPPPPPTGPEQPYADRTGPSAPPPQHGGAWGDEQGSPQQGGAWGDQQGPPQQGGTWGDQQGPPQPGTWQGQPVSGAPGPRLAEGDERTWMLLAHLSAPLAAIFSLGWLSFLGPLLVWMLRKEDSAAVRTASAGAFNFNLSFWLMNLVAWICLFTVILIPVAIIIWVIIWPVAIYAHLRGAWLASKGQVYTYPFQVRVLS